MKKITFLLIIIFQIQNPLFTQWILDYQLPSNKRIWNISFPSDSIGFVNNGYGIFKTTNAGNYWYLIYQYTNYGIKKIKFIDNNTGFFSDGDLYKTTNSGMTWVKKNLPQPYPEAPADDFDCNLDGTVLAGGDSYSWVSKDFGETFYRYLVKWEPLEGIRKIAIINNEKYLCGYSNSYQSGRTTFCATINSGVNWMWIESYSYNYCLSISVYDTRIMCSTMGNVFNFTNTGMYNFHHGYIPGVIEDTHFISDSIILAVGDPGKVKISTNQGNSWFFQLLPKNVFVTDIEFRNKSTGYIVGDSGYIFKTTNGGIVPVININEEIPSKYELSQNYPNPFNPTTKINFAIPKQGFVTLKIYDILGREIKTLVNEIKQAGNYSVDFNASEFSSGVYFYRLESGTFSQIKRMVLVK